MRYVTNTPAWKYKNVRATYKAGYEATPIQISKVSARLAAVFLQRMLNPPKTKSEPAFTEELKMLIRNYRRSIYAFA